MFTARSEPASSHLLLPSLGNSYVQFISILTNFIFNEEPCMTGFHMVGIKMSRVIFCRGGGLLCACYGFLVV